MSLGTLGVTFGTTQGHQKGHLGPPWRTFETRHRKHLKKSLFWDLFWDPNLMTFRVFICPCFYMCSKRRKWGPNVTKCAEKGCLNYICLAITLKLRNCVWTAPARADRGSDPPENPKKTIEKTIFEPTHLQTRFSSKKYFKWSAKIDENLSCQKTESTIVLAMLQSTGKSQVVFSHKRGTGNAS